MDRRAIGYFVHHQGRGHAERCAALVNALPEDRPVSVFCARPEVLPALRDGVEVVRLPSLFEPTGAEANGMDHVPLPETMHCAPLGWPGIRRATRRLAEWFDESDPALLVCDVSAEVAQLARLCSVPHVSVLQHGVRDDAGHRAAWTSAAGTLAPFGRVLAQDDWPAQMLARTCFAGGLGVRTAMPSREAARERLGIGAEERVFLVVAGRRRRGPRQRAARRRRPHLPGRELAHHRPGAGLLARDGARQPDPPRLGRGRAGPDRRGGSRHRFGRQHGVPAGAGRGQAVDRGAGVVLLRRAGVQGTHPRRGGSRPRGAAPALPRGRLAARDRGSLRRARPDPSARLGARGRRCPRGRVARRALHLVVERAPACARVRTAERADHRPRARGAPAQPRARTRAADVPAGGAAHRCHAGGALRRSAADALPDPPDPRARWGAPAGRGAQRRRPPRRLRRARLPRRRLHSRPRPGRRLRRPRGARHGVVDGRGALPPRGRRGGGVDPRGAGAGRGRTRRSGGDASRGGRALRGLPLLLVAELRHSPRRLRAGGRVRRALPRLRRGGHRLRPDARRARRADRLDARCAGVPPVPRALHAAGAPSGVDRAQRRALRRQVGLPHHGPLAALLRLLGLVEDSPDGLRLVSPRPEVDDHGVRGDGGGQALRLDRDGRWRSCSRRDAEARYRREHGEAPPSGWLDRKRFLHRPTSRESLAGAPA